MAPAYRIRSLEGLEFQVSRDAPLLWLASHF